MRSLWSAPLVDEHVEEPAVLFLRCFDRLLEFFKRLF
jgi:hypothetical protein